MRFLALIALSVVAMAVPATAADDGHTRSVQLAFFGEDSRTKTLVDKPPRGDTPSRGDVLRLTVTLVNSGRQLGRRTGATVGTAVQTYRFTSASKATFSQVATLPGGTIRSGGTLDIQGFTQRFRVVGGTGAFTNARGTFELTPITGDTQGQVYRLRLP